MPRSFQSITSSLSSLDIERVVDEKPADLAQYGLAPARIDVSFKVKGQAAREAHPARRQDATGGDIYAKLPDSPRVFLVSSYLESTFKKDPFSLRDKAILKVDRAKVDGFAASGGLDHARVRQEGHGLDHREADRGASRFRRRGGRHRAADVGEHAGHHHGERHRPEAVRPRQADGHDDDEVRQLVRHADAGQDRERGGVRQGRVAAAWSSPWRRRCATTS